MAENDNSNSSTGIKNNLILTNSVYSSSEVTEDYALSVASLLLPVGIILPYCFEPECPVELEASFSNETEEVLVKSGWVIQRWFRRHRSGDHSVTGLHGSSQQSESLHSIYPEV